MGLGEMNQPATPQAWAQNSKLFSNRKTWPNTGVQQTFTVQAENHTKDYWDISKHEDSVDLRYVVTTTTLVNSFRILICEVFNANLRYMADYKVNNQIRLASVYIKQNVLQLSGDKRSPYIIETSGLIYREHHNVKLE